MGNLSQQKRQRMLDFLEKIKAINSDEETVIAINEIENELTDKKYGLVWEKHEEDVDVQMCHSVPVFTEVKEKEIIGEPETDDFNFLLEGDNLHSLKLLEKTHKGKIDVIYIDPPYNTGNKDFKYDDVFRGKEDAFRHSMWLSFMSERLKIARKLLACKGVIFISIDDNEMYALKMLCDEIFGGDSFVTNMIWQKKTGASDARGIATITEYILVYVKNSEYVDEIFDKNYESFDISRYRLRDEYFDRRGNFYYDSLDRGSVRYSDSLNYGIKAPDGTLIYPNGRKEFINDGWTWKWSKEKVQWGIKNGFIDITPSDKKKNGWAVRYKIYLKVDNEDKPIDKSAPYKNIITSVLNANATADIKSMFDGVTIFQYSKPVELIKLLLSYVKEKNGIVLDFFAGSGTTGQAVLEQNIKDNSSRKFILCTNNESGICEKITYKRLEKRITGFSFVGKKEDILYERTLVLKDLNSIENIMDIVKKLINKNTDKYDKIRQEFKEGVFKVIGSNNYKGEMCGIPANLKYYRTDFISKSSDDEYYSVGEKLSEHIKEMVQLDHGISLDNEHYLLLLSDEEADELEKNVDKLAKCKGIYISNSVFLTAEQERLFRDKALITIPDYYFKDELREVGEL